MSLVAFSDYYDSFPTYTIEEIHQPVRSSFQMWITINRPTARSRHLHAILLTATLLLGLSSQNEGGGHICNDQVVWFDKAKEVALQASELLKSFKACYKFPALLEDTQLFGIENQLLFVVPFRLFDSMHVAGKTGRDRVVIDTWGNFVGVILRDNYENSVLPAYKMCRFFLTSEPSHELQADDGYEITGFACKSNFVNAKAIHRIRNICLEYKNLPDGYTKRAFFKDRKCSVDDRGFVCTYMGNRDYGPKHIGITAVYHVVLDPKCTFVNISRYYRKQSQETCLATWTSERFTPTIEDDSVSHWESNKRQEIEQSYTCENFMFKITSIQIYVDYVKNQLTYNFPSILKFNLIKPVDNLQLWPMILPERHGPSRIKPHVFALRFDDDYKFYGIYYANAKTYTENSFKPCPDFGSLKTRLILS